MRLRHTLATLTAATCALVGLTLLAPTAAEAKVPPKPKVGQCHALNEKQLWALSDAKRAVPCSARHSVQTFAVVKPNASLRGTTAEQRSEIAGTSCDAAWERAIHHQDLVVDRTILQAWTFAPTTAQIAAGQSWIRCDVGTMGRLGKVGWRTGRLTPISVVRHSRSDEFALCGTTKLRRWTTCTSPHALRNTTTFYRTDVPGTPYPDDDAFFRSSYVHCPKTTYWVSWPSKDDWDAGARLVRCWKKD